MLTIGLLAPTACGQSNDHPLTQTDVSRAVELAAQQTVAPVPSLSQGSAAPGSAVTPNVSPASSERTRIVATATESKGEWAVVTLRPSTGVDEPVHGFIAIGHFEGNRWSFVFEGQPLFGEWLERLPSNVMTEEMKAFFR